MARVCVFGLGEAGSEIAADLADAGADVTAFDPAPVETPFGVDRRATPGPAAVGADVVIALTASADSAAALEQALSDIQPGTLYADFSTASPGLKRELGSKASSHGLSFTDVALMGTVPGRGIRTPALASGEGATAFVEMMRPFGMEARVVGDAAGEAATRKLLRSVVVKGLAGVVIESMTAATAAGLEDAVWEDIVRQMTDADEAFVRRIVRGTGTHAVRRQAEMVAAANLLSELGVDPIMTDSTVASLDRTMKAGVPELPEREGS